MLIKRTSVLTGITRTLEIPIKDEDYAKWLDINRNVRRWEPIQNIAPYLNSDDREFIISGITKEEWDETFKEDEVAYEG